MKTEKLSQKNIGYRAIISVSLPSVMSMAAATIMEFRDRVFLANYAIAASMLAGSNILLRYCSVILLF